MASQSQQLHQGVGGATISSTPTQNSQAVQERLPKPPQSSVTPNHKTVRQFLIELSKFSTMQEEQRKQSEILSEKLLSLYQHRGEKKSDQLNEVIEIVQSRNGSYSSNDILMIMKVKQDEEVTFPTFQKTELDLKTNIDLIKKDMIQSNQSFQKIQENILTLLKTDQSEEVEDIVCDLNENDSSTRVRHNILNKNSSSDVEKIGNEEDVIDHEMSDNKENIEEENHPTREVRTAIGLLNTSIESTLNEQNVQQDMSSMEEDDKEEEEDGDDDDVSLGTRYIGVYKVSRVNKDVGTQKFTAQIQIRGSRHYLGQFSTEEEAARAYDQVAAHIPNRKLNYPDAEGEEFENIVQGRKKKSSQYIGVNKNKAKWRSYIWVDRKQYPIGRYNTEPEAALAYDEVAKQFPNRKLNFPEGTHHKDKPANLVKDQSSTALRNIALVLQKAGVAQHLLSSSSSSSSSTLPTPQSSPVPTSLPTPLSSPVPSPVPTPLPTPQPSPSPSPSPTPPPDSGNDGIASSLVPKVGSDRQEEEDCEKDKKEVFRCWGAYFNPDENVWVQQLYWNGEEIKNKFSNAKDAAEENDRLVRSLELADRPLNFPTEEEGKASRGKAHLSSKYFGVAHEEISTKASIQKKQVYRSFIDVNDVVMALGTFDNEKDAANAYDLRACQFPEKKLNFRKNRSKNSKQSPKSSKSKKRKVSLDDIDSTKPGTNSPVGSSKEFEPSFFADV